MSINARMDKQIAGILFSPKMSGSQLHGIIYRLLYKRRKQEYILYDKKQAKRIYDVRSWTVVPLLLGKRDRDQKGAQR